MRLAALAAALLLAPSIVAAPPRAPELVSVRVGHEHATGFVAGDGRVLTVAHVLGGGVGAGDAATPRPETVITVDARPATITRVDHRLDLALLRVPGLEGEAPRLGGGGDTRLHGRAAPIVRRISARVDGSSPRPALELRADVAIGDSGAPLVTPTGRVAGVVFARSRDRGRTAYAVDATGVAALLR
jgi:hypothetical protein